MPVQPIRSQSVRLSQNILLRRLSPLDQALLEPHVEQRLIDPGETLIGAADDRESVHFPDSAIFSLVERRGSDRCAEIAVVGREGMLGWPALLGCDNGRHAAICQIQGSVLRIDAAPLLAACARSPTLWPALLKFVHLIIVQMAGAISSQLQDPLDRRLARWLLMRHDRVGGDVLLVHHEEIADRLNVRRASITDGLHRLEGDRMIRCNRGRIAIRDRGALERFAGDSYGIVEAHYRTVIAPFGKSLEQAD